jgi:hypothetical protein
MVRQIPNRIALVIIILTVGICLRFILAATGFTYDMQSYEIVAKIVTAGGNVYGETSRYNYGPLWFIILGCAYRIGLLFINHFLAFRFIITALLVLVDVGIWYILYKKYSYIASILFFLNPISIILTGFYSQFDNFAVLLGLIAMSLFSQARSTVFDRKRMLGLLILGLSLITKHLFFVFPVWLAMSEKGIRKKLLAIMLPLFIFIISFIPYLYSGFDGIKHNVFLYSSFNNVPLWQFIIPDYLKRYVSKELLFFGTLILGAFVFKKKNPMDKLLLYCVVLVTFSYAVADQYFAIPLAYIAIYPNVFFIVFTIIMTFFLSMILQGGEVFHFGFLFARWNFSFTPMVVCLLGGLVYSLYHSRWPGKSVQHMLYFLVSSNIIVYGCLLLPSYQENMRIDPIEKALIKGDYEQANMLYSEIEKNPPFAGSRFWYKLSTIRNNIRYYRIFRHIVDIYEKSDNTLNWIQVRKDLQNIPPYFPDSDMVHAIVTKAEIHISQQATEQAVLLKQ